MLSFAEWLREAGLERYESVFAENDIDFSVVRKLTESDLKELGLTLGHRKKFLDALAALDSHEAALSLKPVQSPSPDAGLSSAGERRQLTVMFCDLVGSTALSEKLDPEELRSLLHDYRTRCGEVIARYEGFVARYVGDGILTYFGWPKAHEEDAERSVRAALEIVQAMKSASSSEPLSIRIGIATGPVVVGEPAGVGDQSKLAVGSTPNLAARLQGLAGPDQIVIAASTRRLIGAAFELLDLGAHTLKGITEPVQPWRVVGSSAPASRFEASHGGHVMPLVGRDSELALLMERWRQAVEGEGQVLVLRGEPGVGKSRIARALRARVAGESHSWVQYQCSPFFANTALYPVIAQVKHAAGFLEEEFAEAKLDKLEALLDRLGGAAAGAAPLLAALLSLPSGERYAPLEMSPRRQKECTLEVIVEQLARIAMHAPLLLVFEDLHWIDPTTRELIDLLVARSATIRMLILLTHRPEFDPPWGAHAHVTLHSLNRLSKRQCADLAAAVASKPLPESLVAQIVDKTDGVPLFVEELTKALLESGLLRDAGDRYELTGAVGSVRIPATLHDSLMARLDKLLQAKEVAQMGAVIGREFSYELLAAVSDLGETALNASLEGCVRSELIYQRGIPPQATYVFKHALVQDAAYDSLLKTRRVQLHQRIAHTLETRFRNSAENEPETVAHHYTAAGLAQQAIPYWLRAGHNAMERGTNREAIGHLARGLEELRALPCSADGDGKELELLLALGEAQTRSGEYLEARQTLEGAAAKARAIGSPEGLARAALVLEPQTWQIGLTDTASSHVLFEANQLLGESESILKSRVLTGLALTWSYAGSPHEAARAQKQALALAQRLGDPMTVAFARSVGIALLLNTRWMPEQLRIQLSHREEAKRLAEQADNQDQVMRYLPGMIIPALLLASDATAKQWIDELDRLGRQQRPFYRYFVMTSRIALAMFEGRFEESETLAREALTFGQTIPGLDGTGAYSVQMFSLRREQGRLKELALLVRHFAQTTEVERTWRLGLALIYAELGMTKEARAEFASLAANNFAAVPEDGSWLNSMGMLAEICCLLGDEARAATLYDLLLPYARCNVLAPPIVACYGVAARHLGMLATIMRRWEEAESHFELALELNDKQGGRPYVAHTQQQYAQMLLARDAPHNRHRAKALLEAALATARELGMSALAQRTASVDT